LASSPVKLNTNEAKWKKVSDLETNLVEKQHKYLSGSFSSLKEATEKQAHWRQNGFADAFIVAYQGNVRITLAKAKELLGE